VALTKVDNPIKELQTGIPRGAPFDIYTARSKGVSSALAWQYVHSGWLQRLERGVFMFPNDNLQRDPSLKFLAKRLPGFHVGGKTALAWRGIRHYLAPREHLILWGEEYGKLPEWFTSRFPSRYVAKRLFSKELPSGYACQPLPESPDGPMVSTPERALLEMLSEVGLQQGIEEARLIMESVHSLRPEVLEKLLKNCLRIKVQRLCVQWAQELNLDWSPVARAAVTLGKSYWCTRLKDGTTLTLKP
jgi:Transcriptional regulator, AbiEi antitoxin, Type IV TA system/Transcriptional regulator, AbiEi antitoxin N-terminal domain